MNNEANTAAPAAPVAEWMDVARVLRADFNDPAAVLAAAQVAAKALHGVERFKAAPAPVAGDAVAYLVERIEGRGYGRARKVLDAAQWNPLDAAFWSDADAQRRHRVTPLYALAQDRASQAGAAGVPEGCTPEDAAVLRKANHALAEESARLRAALEFYAEREHFIIADSAAWDTVSGEPQNLWCDDAGTATVEDGGVARHALSAPTPAAEGEVRRG